MACRRSKPRRICGGKKDGHSQRGLGPAGHRAEKGLPEGTESKGQGVLTNQLYSYLLYGISASANILCACEYKHIK